MRAPLTSHFDTTPRGGILTSNTPERQQCEVNTLKVIPETEQPLETEDRLSREACL